MTTDNKPDYSKTVNLPQTEFPMKANLPVREPEFIKKWETEDTYKQIGEKNKSNPKFILHDGPPYANGRLHMGHALNKILKDLIIKYKSMNGFYSPYTPGWDCHGLPIEQQCMKDMKVDKHKIGLPEFRKAAAAFAQKYVDIQRDEFKRLGILGQWDKPYLTMDPKFEAVIVKVFGGLVKNGYIYRKKKPVYWCPTCETAMADAEVEYADHVSHSVFVKFAVVSLPQSLNFSLSHSLSVLIWTTTPWTLPANVALAFHPESDYVYAVLKTKEGKEEHLIFAKKLLPVVAEKIGATEYKIINEFTGDKLEGIKCRNPLMERESVGILADYVTLEDGTGVVHIAPGHGQDDYIASLKYKLPIISPVDDRGAFTDEVPEFKGHKVFAANPLIVEKLKALDALLYDDKLTHSYPHCWRCKRAIIFRATPQWFMSVEHESLRQTALKIIKNVKWVPAYGENRIAGMVETRPDWCLSRQRLWGVPIPVFYCEKCGEPLLEEKIINEISKLFGEKGSDVWFERTAAELLSGMQAKCKCGNETFRKEQDILDVWFDSGVSHEAVLASGNYTDLTWPADMYLEGSDQHRGWFQTSLLPSAALRKAAPYKTVLTHGFVVDGEGKKMSKSVGNVVAPQDLIKQYGADIIRLWTATSDYREDIRISPEIIKGLADSYRKIRNTLRFLLGNISDFDVKTNSVAYEDLREIDRFALSRLQELVREVTNAYETFEFHRAANGINRFCTVDLSGFYLDALKDTLYCDGKEWPSRRSAQTVLYTICSTLIKMTAPILSFTAEEAWQEMRKKDATLPGSVLLTDFPKVDEQKIFSGEISKRWAALMEIRENALMQFEELRKKKEIGSNLEARAVIGCDERDVELLSNVLGTWDVRVDRSAKICVEAKKSELKKCDRCWRCVDGVDAEGLCPRCRKAVGK